ncbi:MAG: hypothetical protein K8R36_24610 [Planctomycetales bacterium]|nr:hypothetical protein [Planctomycetales bacterium]
MNAKLTIAAGLVALLFGAGAASAQQYGQETSSTSGYVSEPPQPSSSFGAGANSYATTEAGSTLEGLGSALAGAGQYNLYSSRGALYLEQARSKYIENYRNAIDARYAIKRVNDTYRAEKFARERMNPELLSRVIQAKLPDRLSAAEYNRRTGALQWPAALMGPEFARDRHAVQIAFAQRRSEDVGVVSVFYRDVSQHVQNMYETMLSQIDDIPTTDSIAARRFLKSLEYEARHLPSDTDLAINNR